LTAGHNLEGAVGISPVSSSSLGVPQTDSTPPSQGGQTPQPGEASGAQALPSHKSHGHHHHGGGAKKAAAAPAATAPSDPNAPGANFNVTT
jgi:hypothetical protein